MAVVERRKLITKAHKSELLRVRISLILMQWFPKAKMDAIVEEISRETEAIQLVAKVFIA